MAQLLFLRGNRWITLDKLVSEELYCSVIRTLTESLHKKPHFWYQGAELQRSSKTYPDYRLTSLGKRGTECVDSDNGLWSLCCVHKLNATTSQLCDFGKLTFSLKSFIHSVQNGESDTWTSELLSELNEIMCESEKLGLNFWCILLVREEYFRPMSNACKSIKSGDSITWGSWSQMAAVWTWDTTLER